MVCLCNEVLLLSPGFVLVVKHQVKPDTLLVLNEIHPLVVTINNICVFFWSTDIFKYDPDFLENENKYKEIKRG